MQKIYEIKKVNIADHASLSHDFLFEKNEFCSSFCMHWHSYYEIEYVASGELSEIYNGAQIALSQGMLRLLTPADFHEVIAERPVTLYKACFDASLLERELSARLYRSSLGRAVSLSEAACRLIESLFESALLSQNAAYEDAVLRALKKSENKKGTILRLYESMGLETYVHIDISLLSRSADLSFKPFEIKTLFVPDEKDGKILETDIPEFDAD